MEEHKNISVKKNFIYNIIYQLLILILPLITVPYVSRTLGAENIGVYSYTYSIVYYFMLVAMLGINNYGNRTIAKSRENKEELSRNFWGIYTIQITLTIIMSICYFIYVVFFANKYKLISTIQIIYLVSNAMDINWFFFGLEKFKLTITRNTIIKILSLICILLFVKSKNDLFVYTLILSLSTLLSQLMLWPFLKNEINILKITKKDITKHIKQCTILFIPVIAISLYKVMDKIMIEKLSNVKEVGYYEQAEKIINIPLGIITALGTVMLPKISNLIANNNENKIQEYIDKSINFIMFLAFPICLGIIAVSKNVVIVLLGNDFFESINILELLSITIIFISFANVIRTQFLIPKELDRIYTISVLLGAIVNLVCNSIFIPKYSAVGACIGTILAEFIVMFYQIIKTKNELPIYKYIKNIIPYFAKSIIMFIVVYSINFVSINAIIKIIIQITIGCLIYIVLNWKYINAWVNIRDIINKIRSTPVR